MGCMQISNFLKFGKIENSVNFPNINSDTVAKHRIFITNKNHPGIISQVAETLAKKAQDKKITKIFFDRGIYKYHGRIKIFAETLRKNGMDF